MAHETKRDAGHEDVDPTQSDRPSVEDQKFHLLDLQTHQSQRLETTGLAGRAREHMLQNFEKAREAAETTMGVRVDLPLDLTEGSDMTRLMAAIRVNDTGEILLGVRFVTAEVKGEGAVEEHVGFIPVGLAVPHDGQPPRLEVLGTDRNFYEEDTSTLAELLNEVMKQRAEGLLPDLDTADLATIHEPDTVLPTVTPHS